MIVIENLLYERYLTITEESEKLQYLDDVWKILTFSYAKIGGIASIQNKEQLLDSKYFWKLVRKNNKIVAVTIYKGSYTNRKLALGGSDGTPEGKQAFFNMCEEDATRVERGTWAEVSGAMKHIYIFKYGATPIPADLATKILNDVGKEVLSISKDGYHYTRRIGNQNYEKIMMGNVPQKYRTDDWEKEREEYKTKFHTYVKNHPEEVQDRRNRH